MSHAMPPNGRAAAGLVPVATRMLIVACLGASVVGCKHGEEERGHVAGWTLVEPSQRHPILVSQQPARMTVRIARGSAGLSPPQRSQVLDFAARYRARGGVNRLVISVPSGSANEIAAMNAVADIRHLIGETGFSDSDIVVEPYHEDRDAQPPIRISFMHYVAEGPECGTWSSNLSSDTRNLNHANFGCAQQRNLAAQVANPADLLGPRTMTASSAERRDIVGDKYKKGEVTSAAKTQDERASTKGNN